MTIKQASPSELEFFRTADLALATAISLFLPLEEIDRQDPRKARFVFRRSDKLEEYIEKYWHREMKVDPAAYFEAMRIIKGRLYE